MSEYMFGVRRGKLTKREQAARERAAKKHGAWFIYANIPGDGLKSWFACRNYGAPFDQRTAAAVLAELAE